jgi:hypothetical protein
VPAVSDSRHIGFQLEVDHHLIIDKDLDVDTACEQQRIVEFRIEVAPFVWTAKPGSISGSKPVV